MVNAAKLIREVVDPGGVAWGPVYYLLDYTSAEIKEKLLKDPALAYDDPKKKSRPHLIVMDGGPALAFAEKPTVATVAPPAPQAAAPAPKVAPAVEAAVAPKPAKVKKPKAAQNDDPS